MIYEKLANVAEFINGAAFKPTEWEKMGKKIIRIQNLTNKKKPYNRTTRKVNKKLYVNYGDLLVSWSASLGVFIWKDKEEAVLNQHIFKVIPKVEVIDKNYLRYCLDNAINSMLNHLHGSTMKHINRGDLLATKIPLPSLLKQKKIATQLDKANSVLNLCKLSIDKLDELAQSMFWEMDKSANLKFKLDEISEIVSGATPKSKIKEYWNGKIPWVTPAELKKLDNIFINDTLRKITNEGLQNCSASLLPINSILFSSRAPIGHIAINTVPMATNQGFKSFIINNSIVEPIYLYYWLSHNRELLQNMGVGATFKELSKNLISSIKINLPNLSKQNIFVKKINSLNKIKKNKKKIILKNLELIASLQQQSFGIN